MRKIKTGYVKMQKDFMHLKSGGIYPVRENVVVDKGAGFNLNVFESGYVSPTTKKKYINHISKACHLFLMCNESRDSIWTKGIIYPVKDGFILDDSGDFVYRSTVAKYPFFTESSREDYLLQS